jgi:hypothetical protein
MTTNTARAKFWEFKKYSEYRWFARLVVLLLALVALYLLVHLWVDKKMNPGKDYEYSKLDSKQKTILNGIYFDSAKLNDVERHTMALEYVKSAFSNKVDTSEFADIKRFLTRCSKTTAAAYVADYRFKVESNFWLIGPLVYWEIVFWSLFGVISSLLFSLGLLSTNATTDPNNPQTVFDSSEIPGQVAKLLYAPLCTLVIVFGYNFFADENIVDISSSKGVIVFAFLGGFYSSRLISFLDRLKEVLLPISSNAVMPRAATTSQAALANVKVALEPDSTIAGDIRNEIIEAGFNTATVELEHKEKGTIIKAEPPQEDQSNVFVVPSIPPGKYLIKVSWAKELDGEVVNLSAKQEVEIKSAEEVVKIVLSKSEASG